MKKLLRWRLMLNFSALLVLFLLTGLGNSTWSLFAANAKFGQPQSVPSVTRMVSTLVTQTPSQDTSIFENSPASGGASPVLVAGETGSFGARRALLKFDLSAIPTGATIVSATLKLQVTKVSNTTPVSFTLHTLTQNWGEAGSNNSSGTGAPAEPGDATWEYAIYTSTMWSNAGGDFVSAASATTEVGSLGTYFWNSPQLVGDLQSWLAAPTENYGWILMGDEAASKTAKLIGSRESTEATARPELTILYELPVTQTHIFLPLIQR